MKKLLTFLLFSVFLIIGCNQESEITSPVDTGQILYKKLIELPPSSGLTLDTMTDIKDINGNYGGVFSSSYSYQGGPYGTVSQYSTLDFDAGAFSGVKTISQTFNTGGAAMEFGPSMQFQAEVEYSYKIVGVDLTGINPATLDFVYIDANGNMFPVVYESVSMDETTGTLEVVDAEIPHFSRYGFVN